MGNNIFTGIDQRHIISQDSNNSSNSESIDPESVFFRNADTGSSSESSRGIRLVMLHACRAVADHQPRIIEHEEGENRGVNIIRNAIDRADYPENVPGQHADIQRQDRGIFIPQERAIEHCDFPVHPESDEINLNNGAMEMLEINARNADTDDECYSQEDAHAGRGRERERRHYRQRNMERRRREHSSESRSSSRERRFRLSPPPIAGRPVSISDDTQSLSPPTSDSDEEMELMSLFEM